jgi:hypothetical protein
MFILRLARARTARLSGKFRSVYDFSGSRWQASAFVLRFIGRRSGYLIAHLFARWRRPPARARRAAARPDRPSLAVKVSGGLGDYVVAALYLRDLAAQVEPISFDLYCSNSAYAKWIFAPVPGFGSVYTEFLFDDLKAGYDLGLTVNQYVMLANHPVGMQGLGRSPLLLQTVGNIARSKPLIEHLIREDPLFDNFVARRAVYMNLNRVSFSYGLSKIKPGDGRLELATDETPLKKLGLERGRFMTIHNGFNPDVVTIGRKATKTYPRFGEVVRLIKAERPDVKIVQLGAKTSAPIAGTDHNLVGKTDLRQAAALLRHAAWHIDVESGLVHLAHCLGTRATVVFGPTPSDYFGYPDNESIPPAACGGCWWITETWMSHCPRRFAAPICMNQDPATIAYSVLNAIARRKDAFGESTQSAPAAAGASRQ